ncbi:MAG: tetratricopeptide repeat protein, partial [Pseudomonadota bacterium]|nr:tetratricopeptide repeat protein [Pseudomonadota bacterium]
RFAWRGDDLELDILHRLGQFYIQAKNVKAGLNTLSRAVQLYPNSPMIPGIRAQMADIFRDVFLSDLGNDLSPLDALTLYQQYRSLMPGGSDGIAVMRNLAERLVQIDLLDQAAGLLEDLVKNALQGDEKGRVSARLAAIRLLDHKPEQAMAGLDLAPSTTYPADLQNERTLLRAKALSELKKYDEAIALLNSNSSNPAKLLRADIDMRAQRWKDASVALIDLIGPAPTGTALSQDQAQWLVNCAIAVSMAGDTAGLEKLRADYGPAMASLPQNDTFRMLTEPEKTEQSRDIAAAQAKIADVDMFQGFLNSYRQDRAPPPKGPRKSSTP